MAYEWNMAVPVVGPNSPVRHLISRSVIEAPADATLAEAASTMRKANVSALLVGDDRRIATERDITRALAAGLSPDAPVAAVATPRPITVGPETTVIEAAACMLNDEVRHLLVQVGERGEGIVSMRDVMAVLLQAATPQVWLSSLRLAIRVSDAT